MQQFLRSVLPVVALTLIAADDPAPKYRVVAPKDDGIIATAINNKGDIAGFEWRDDKFYQGVVNQEPIFASGKHIVTLPLLNGYTATFPAGISDDGLVTGRVSKPMRPGVRIMLQNQAFVWDEKRGILGLGVLPGDWASFASAITRDGKRVGGFSIGDGTLRACVWDRDGENWKVSALPESQHLGSQSIALSDDGKLFAATEGALPCLWKQDGQGRWERRIIGEPGSMIPRGVNRAGLVVGIRSTGDGRTHAVTWSNSDGMKLLDKPAGYERSEALGVNNMGTIVGMIDGPHGSKTGPHAFVYENGRLRILTEGGPNFVSATAINDHGQITGTMEKDEDEKAEEPRKEK